MAANYFARARAKTLYCIGAFGIAGLLALVFATTNPEWRPHFLNMLYRSWIRFQGAEGSSTTGIISNWLQPILIMALTLLIIWNRRGWQAVMDHWKQEILTALRVALMVSVVLYAPVFIWEAVKTVYSEHMALIAVNTQLRNDNARLQAGPEFSFTIHALSSGHYKGYTLIVLGGQLTNHSISMALLDWDMTIKLGGKSIQGGIPPFSGQDVSLPLPGQKEQMVLPASNYLPIKTETPIPVNGVVEGWIWSIFNGVTVADLYDKKAVVALTFVDAATSTKHTATRVFDIRGIHMPGSDNH